MPLLGQAIRENGFNIVFEDPKEIAKPSVYESLELRIRRNRVAVSKIATGYTNRVWRICVTAPCNRKRNTITSVDEVYGVYIH